MSFSVGCAEGAAGGGDVAAEAVWAGGLIGVAVTGGSFAVGGAGAAMAGDGAFIAVVVPLPALGAIRSGAVVAFAGGAGLLSDWLLDSAPSGTRCEVGPSGALN